MLLSIVVKIDLFLSNSWMVNFLKQTKKKASCHTKLIKGLKLQSIQILGTVFSSSSSGKIPFDRKILPFDN